MKILFLSGWFPYPPNNGAKLRIYNLLRGLAPHHQVTLLAFADQPDVNPEVSELHSLCDRIQVIPWKPYDPNSRRARLGFLSLTPSSVVDTYSLEMEGRIREELSSGEYDLVIASQWAMASYGACFTKVPALFEEVEVGVPYQQYAGATSLWHRFRFGLTWAKQRIYLRRLLHSYRACTVVSEPERALLSSAVPGYQAIEVIPNCISLADYRGINGDRQRNTLIFTGPFGYLANYEAMTWFLEEVYPRVQAQVPDVRLIVTGDHANLPLPAADNLTLTGFVDDVRPLIHSASISLAPIRVGGGTRLKILEAMALHTPVVSTTKGAEGLDVQDGKDLLIADSPAEFADAVLRLLGDPGFGRALAEKGHQLVRERYDWPAVMPEFLDLLERVART
jgi:glycosyltransferase involved in cell wall biosynthesis